MQDENKGKELLPAQDTAIEYLQISPEDLKVANTYLTCENITDAADVLGIPSDQISTIVAKREVKAYIDTVFMDTGYNNRFLMRSLMDTLVKTKLQEMAESQTTTKKDIVEVLALSHKFTMDYIDKQIKLESMRYHGPKNQLNVQVNNDNRSNYELLLEKIMKPAVVEDKNIIDVDAEEDKK